MSVIDWVIKGFEIPAYESKISGRFSQGQPLKALTR